jgi:hypothetical protein
MYNSCGHFFFKKIVIYAGVHLLLTNKFLVRMAELLFDDIFRVECVNLDGKKFDKGMLMEYWCLFTRICS